MGSPAAVLGANSQWQSSSAPEAVQANDYESQDAGIILKPMRLKVLYTFDDQNKTNCLARWPHVLDVQTVAIDESTSIGVIELKICIQAIVQCSPELVAKLGQDYTVYAYDYSEYDNPLVGQGMLSWALAAASSTPVTPAHQSRQLITGRVCKNILGLFTNGVKETLEVKLRLVPVPTALQSEYLESIEKYRELSKIIPTGFDAKEWTTFVQSNPNIAQLANKISSSTNNVAGQRDGASMEIVNQLLSPSLQSQDDSADPFNNTRMENGLPNGRASSPPNGRTQSQMSSRPSSRNSIKRPRKPKAKSFSNGGNTSGYEEGTDGDDVPARKKRAKITKADWNSKSSFGTASDSLRVAASTSGSLRMFRPIAAAPGGIGGSHLQELPRAPTPVPGETASPMDAENGTSVPTNLRRCSLLSQSLAPAKRYRSPYVDSDAGGEPNEIRISIESAMTSPERNQSPDTTPPNMRSSPPVLRMGTSLTSSPPQQSSPMLPPMPKTDSGFFSGSIDDLFEDLEGLPGLDEEEEAPPAVANSNTRRRTSPVKVHHGFAIAEETPGPPELLPTKILPRPEPRQPPKPKEPKPKAPRLSRAGSTVSEGGSRRPGSQARGMISNVQQNNTSETGAANPLSYSEAQQAIDGPPPSLPAMPPPHTERPNTLLRTMSAGMPGISAVAASDPILPRSKLQRSQTWSDAPHPTTDGPDPATQSVNTGVVRPNNAKKEAIRHRLEEAIVNGEMPPFCNNCGAIETPTWRKAWAQEIKGQPGYHDYSDEPGRVTAIDILERDMDGKPTSYRLIKKSLKPGEQKADFTEYLLCNPCGIWMSKYKTRRPEDKWNKEQGPSGDSKKRIRPSKSKKVQAIAPNINPTSEAYFPSDAPGPCDDQNPPSPRASVSQQWHQAPVETRHDDTELVHSQRKRASSLRPSRAIGMTSDAATAALRRAIQSSPVRLLGSQCSPIELEEEQFGSTRRLLFPSPRKDGVAKALGEVVTNCVHIATAFDHDQAKSTTTATLTHASEPSNKENHPPPFDADGADADLIKLLEEELARPSPSRHQTPPPRTSAAATTTAADAPMVFKTPTRRTPGGDHHHRPITRSQSKSAARRSAQKFFMLAQQQSPSKTPTSSSARLCRRSPRNHGNSNGNGNGNGSGSGNSGGGGGRSRDPTARLLFEDSPFTSQLREMLAAGSPTPTPLSSSSSSASSRRRHRQRQHQQQQYESPSRHLMSLAGMDMDFQHHGGGGGGAGDLDFGGHLPSEMDLAAAMGRFDAHHDFFSTDVPMPSSPPMGFLGDIGSGSGDGLRAEGGRAGDAHAAGGGGGGGGLFDLYEDATGAGVMAALDGDLWGGMGGELVVDGQGRARFEMVATTAVATAGSKMEDEVDAGGRD